MSIIPSEPSITEQLIRTGFFFGGVACLFYGAVYYQTHARTPEAVARLRNRAPDDMHYDRTFDPYENQRVERFKGALWAVVGIAMIAFSALNLPFRPLYPGIF